jgi:drug/metabolite transporter (DMT)-like permease
MRTMTREDAAYRATGTLYAGGAAMLFASKGLLAKLLYARGVDFQTLTLLRALLALPLFWGLLALHDRGRHKNRTGRSPLPRQPRSALLGAGLAGALCYGIGSLLDFRALELIDAAMERALLFSYPSLVVLYSAYARRAWPVWPVVVAVLLTYLGICLVVGGFSTDAWRENALGALLVLGCAVSYATYFLVGERHAPTLGGVRFTAVAMTCAAVVIAPSFAATHSFADFAKIDSTGWGLIAALTIACLFLPSLMQTEGIRRIGAVRGAIISTVGPPTTMVLAALLIQERPHAWQIVGTLLIIVGVFVIGRYQQRT